MPSGAVQLGRPRPPSPFEATGEDVSSWLADLIEHDALALWLLDEEGPTPDRLLVAHGGDEEALLSWAQDGWRQDPLFASVQGGGVASMPCDRTAFSSSCTNPGASALLVRLPESTSRTASWTLLLLREAAGFTPAEQAIASHVLRHFRATFDAAGCLDLPDLCEGVGEPARARALFSVEGGLLHADPTFDLLLLRAGVSPTVFSEQLCRISEQRWPEGPERDERDFVIDLGPWPVWVVLREVRPLEDPRTEHRRIELRRIGADELPSVGALSDERVGRTLGYIHDHYFEAPTLETIAKVAHVSPFHFHRLFSRQVGVSPKRYVLMKQLQEARWRLRSRRCPIGTVAEECGFGSQAHFAAAFRKAVGVSPREFRTRCADAGENGESDHADA
jgi:AraC-like DNA-binding protein